MTAKNKKKLLISLIVLNIILCGILFLISGRKIKKEQFHFIPKVETIKEIKQPKEKEIILPDVVLIDTTKKAIKKEDEKQTIKINPFKFQIEKLTTKGLIQEEYKKPLFSTVFITDTGTVKIKKYKGLKIAAAAVFILIAGVGVIKLKLKK